MLYVPQALNNLFSVSCLDESGGHAIMGDGCIHLYDKNKSLIAVGQKIEWMYLMSQHIQPLNGWPSRWRQLILGRPGTADSGILA